MPSGAQLCDGAAASTSPDALSQIPDGLLPPTLVSSVCARNRSLLQTRVATGHGELSGVPGMRMGSAVLLYRRLRLPEKCLEGVAAEHTLVLRLRPVKNSSDRGRIDQYSAGTTGASLGSQVLAVRGTEERRRRNSSPFPSVSVSPVNQLTEGVQRVAGIQFSGCLAVCGSVPAPLLFLFDARLLALNVGRVGWILSTNKLCYTQVWTARKGHKGYI
jgi:hypothetical protein